MIMLFEDNAGHLFLFCEGEEKGFADLELTGSLFRADANAVAQGYTEDWTVSAQDRASLQAVHVASYFCDDDLIQIHREFGAAAKDYVYGARQCVTG